MKRAVLYARVSTEMQAAESRNSLDAQRAAFHARWPPVAKYRGSRR